MKSLAWIAAAAFFFVSPGFACGPAEPEFQYGAAEMRAAVEGNWTMTVTPDGEVAHTYSFRLVQQKAQTAAAGKPRAGLVRAAYACGTRTLVASASACVDVTEMPLAVVDVQYATNSPPTATLEVPGLVFALGWLSLSIDGHAVSADLLPDGTVQSPTLTPNGQPSGTVTLRRL
jgi:hypothetical protein